MFADYHPMDSLSLDFTHFRGKPLLVAVDRSSGYLFATFCKDQTSNTAIKFLHQLSARYGYPLSVRSDNGLSFRGEFSAELQKYGISHNTSGPYNPSGNGLAEQGVACLKAYLHKLGPMDQLRLDEKLYFSAEGSSRQLQKSESNMS